MAQNTVKPKAPKAPKAKGSKKNTVGSSAARGRPAKKDFIATSAKLLAMPIGEFTGDVLDKVDFASAVDYDVVMHTPKSGQYAGEECRVFLITTPDGKVHRVWEALAYAIGWAGEHDPLQQAKFVAFKRDDRKDRPQAK